MLDDEVVDADVFYSWHSVVIMYYRCCHDTNVFKF